MVMHLVHIKMNIKSKHGNKIIFYHALYLSCYNIKGFFESTHRKFSDIF